MGRDIHRCVLIIFNTKAWSFKYPYDFTVSYIKMPDKQISNERNKLQKVLNVPIK